MAPRNPVPAASTPADPFAGQGRLILNRNIDSYRIGDDMPVLSRRYNARLKSWEYTVPWSLRTPGIDQYTIAWLASCFLTKEQYETTPVPAPGYVDADAADLAAPGDDE